MDEAYTDTGTIIPPDHFAIIVARDGECRILVPKGGPEDNIPEPWLAATMVGIKFMKDPEWVQELVDEFTDNVKRKIN